MNPVTTADIINTAEGLAVAYIPGAAPLLPLIDLIATAIRAHYSATGQWPTADQVHASLPTDAQKLHADVLAWKPSGDGTLPTAPQGQV